MDFEMKGKNFPAREARVVLAWMREQMCGKNPTVWTWGNEHDAMDQAAGFIDMLLWKYCGEEVV